MPIAEGVVSERGLTKNQNPKIKIGADWYIAAKGLDVSGVKEGQKIFLEYTLLPDFGNMRSMKSWGLSPHQPSEADTVRANGALNQAVNSMSKDEMIFVSVVVKAAFDKDHIKAHTDLSTWVRAAVKAMRHWDDEIPI